MRLAGYHGECKVKGRPSLNGYIYVRIGPGGAQRCLLLHRVKFFLIHGYLPSKVDHKDEDKLNNLSNNLRAATNQDNMRNVRRALRPGGFPRGVDQVKSGRFRARGGPAGTNTYLGTYGTVEEADAVVRAYLRSLHGEFYKSAERPKVGKK